MNDTELTQLAQKVIEKLKNENLTLGLAESCTGGLLSKYITDVSGASSVYPGGICSYSNEVKMNLLGVKKETLENFGAVSEQVARQMANGVRKAVNSDIGIGITGIAGPLSDNTEKPVGLIFISIKTPSKEKVIQLNNKFTENIREQNRLSAVKTALLLLLEE